MWLWIVTGVGLASLVAVVAATTVTGARARGSRPATAVLAGLLFPVTWVVWYVVDEHRHRSAPH